MTIAGLPAESQVPASSGSAEVDLAAAFQRAVGAVGAGERRSWDLPEAPDAGPSTAQVAKWLRQMLTVPWCLDSASVTAVCRQFDRFLADDARPGRIEVVCHTVVHRRPIVYLAVSPRHDGALQPPRIARIDAVVESAA